MRLLMVTPNFPPAVGGVQNYAASLASAFSSKTAYLEVLAQRHAGSRVYDARQSFTVRRHTDPGDNFALSAIPFLLPTLRRGRFDAIFATHWSAAFASWAASAGRTPLGCAVHGKEIFIDPLASVPGVGRAYRQCRRTALQKATLFPVSQYTADAVAQRFAKHGPIHVVHNGVDSTRFSPQETEARMPGPVRLLTVGRLVKRKGIDTTLAALATLRELPWSYSIVGEGPDRLRLQKIARQFGLVDRVSFVGGVAFEALVDTYRSCDVFVMTPTDIGGDVEGFGLVFLEAGACAKPVIGTRSGGVPDAIVDGKTGLLVPPEDPNALAIALRRLISDAELRSTLGRAGRQHAERESWSHVADQILEQLPSGAPQSSWAPQ